MSAPETEIEMALKDAAAEFQARMVHPHDELEDWHAWSFVGLHQLPRGGRVLLFDCGNDDCGGQGIVSLDALEPYAVEWLNDVSNVMVLGYDDWDPAGGF